MVRKLIINILLLSLGEFTFSQNFFFNQHGAVEPEYALCDESFSYSAGESYPSDTIVYLGDALGTVSATFNAVSVPDRLIIYFDDNVVIDTGYRGSYGYDYGDYDRLYFTNGLTGKIDPITGNTYPDLVTYPDDGYPRVIYPPNTYVYFTKATTTNICIVKVYAPLSGTVWNCSVNCPE